MGFQCTVCPETGDVSVQPTLIHRPASINPDKQTGSQGLQPGLTAKGIERDLQKLRLQRKKQHPVGLTGVLSDSKNIPNSSKHWRKKGITIRGNKESRCSSQKAPAGG